MPVAVPENKEVSFRKSKWLFLCLTRKTMWCKVGGGLLVSLLIVSGCSTSRSVTAGRTTTTATDYNSYNEDLALVRPVYGTTASTPPTSRSNAPVSTAPATRKPEVRRSTASVEALHVNRRLDLVLDTLAAHNRTIRYAPGFRIQIYVGNQRQQVESAKLLMTQNFPELSPYLSYNQPTYKLKVGDFMRRLDAERYYNAIKQLITSAQLQADKVDIRRSLLIK